MSLFPSSFLEDLKSQTDIVSVIGEVVSLRKAGATFKGLCPFHQEKSPSFNVSGDKGFFKCFGCGAGGDVVTFVELHQKVAFPEAVRYLAQRAGMTVPEADGGTNNRAAAAERESLIALHEDALVYYREQLAAPAGARARRELESRGLSAETIGVFRYGYAPAAGKDTLHGRFMDKNVPLTLQLKSRLVSEREDGRIVDFFRHRLMIPIARENGSVVAFGGRSLDQGQVPKYLNSPETPIYTKGRTLYGLDVAKAAIRKHNYSVLVEGYFDLAQVWQSGVQSVLASCGTALTVAQARSLKRFTSKVVLSFDPDAAGTGAAARSSELMVAEGFQVNVALLPEGSDPDTFIRREGGRAYVDRLTGSRPYLDFLLDRAAARHDVNRPDGRRGFLNAMLTVAATIPDAAARDQFADRLAHKARITESVVRDEIRKAAAQGKKEAPAIAVAATVRIRPAEQGLLWLLDHRPVEGLAALAQLEDGDLDGLLAGPILALARGLCEVPPELLPGLLRERLSEGGRLIFERATLPDAPTASPSGCVNALKHLRLEREIGSVQEEFDLLESRKLPRAEADAAFAELSARKRALIGRLEDLKG